MASDPRDLTDNMEQVLPGSSTRLLRLLILGVLHRADEVSFKFIAVITRNIGSSGEGPCTLGEQVHALVWLIDRGLVRMKTRQHRDYFWEAVQENLSFYATDRGNDLITRMHQEQWHDDAPGFAVLEEGGAELSPPAITFAERIIASLSVGNSTDYSALNAPIVFPTRKLSSTLVEWLVLGLVVVTVLLVLSVLIWGRK